MNHLLKILMVVAIFGLYPSCSVTIPDAAYLDGQDGFSNAYVPDHMIHGKWIKFRSSTTGYQITGSEKRSNYQFLSGGRGWIQEATQDHRNGGLFVVEAPISWENSAPNRWIVNVPSASEFRVINSDGSKIHDRKAYSFHVLYAKGRLYDVDSVRTLVPLDQANKYISEERGRIQRGEAMPFLIGL